MAYNFTRTRKCAICGAKTKTDRAVPQEQIVCATCRPAVKTPSVQASEPAGDNHE